MDLQRDELPQLGDRRYALRQKCRVETLMIEHACAGLMTAIVLDISREGFRFLLPDSIPCGDEIILHPPPGSDLLKIRATVVRQSISAHDDRRMIECGAQVADTAAWRKHNWFLALRTGSDEYENSRETCSENRAA